MQKNVLKTQKKNKFVLKMQKNVLKTQQKLC